MHLFHGKIVALAAQTVIAASLGKSAKLAAIVANIGVIDIAVDRVTDPVATQILAQFVSRHHSRVEMWQQAGFPPHQFRHRGQVLDGGGIAHVSQCIASRRIAQLGFVSQGEQRLVAARLLATSGNLQYLIG